VAGEAVFRNRSPVWNSHHLLKNLEAGGIEFSRLEVSALPAECSLNLVSVNGPAIDALVAGSPYLRKGSIPGDFYGLTSATPTFGVSAALMTMANMDPRVVATWAGAIGARIDKLKRKHPVLINLSKTEMMIGRMPASLHQAALHTYQDLGWN
jgi:uncharacterized protein